MDKDKQANEMIEVLRPYLLGLLHVVQIFVKISLMKMKVCISTMKIQSVSNNL